LLVRRERPGLTGGIKKGAPFRAEEGVGRVLLARRGQWEEGVLFLPLPGLGGEKEPTAFI